jgi:hypothetical protein
MGQQRLNRAEVKRFTDSVPPRPVRDKVHPRARQTNRAQAMSDKDDISAAAQIVLE